MLALPFDERRAPAGGFAVLGQRSQVFVGGAEQARTRQHLHLQAIAQAAFSHARWHCVGVAGASGLAHLEYFPVYGLGDGFGDVQVRFDGEG